MDLIMPKRKSKKSSTVKWTQEYSNWTAPQKEISNANNNDDINDLEQNAWLESLEIIAYIKSKL